MRHLVPLFALSSLALSIGVVSCGSDTNEGKPTGPGTTGTGGHGDGGNTGGSGGTAACIPGLESIALTPADSKVSLDGKSAAPITFKATGTFKKGDPAEIPGSALDWTVERDDDTPPGTIADGIMKPNPSAGGVVKVSATDGCDMTGTTTVTFFLDVTVGTPSDPNAWAGNPETGGSAPSIVYPSDQTRFPRNIYRTLFQWRSEGFTEFRLIFHGPNSKVTVFTDGVHGLCLAANPPAGCWEVDEIDWGFIAASNAGSTAKWTVDALDTSTMPPTVRRSEEIEIGFSKQDVEGAIFYWSTTSAGVRRGRISQQNPEDYIVGKPSTTYPDGDAIKCVACHVVSRDGKYLAAAVDATSGQSLWITEVTKDPPPTPLVKQVENTQGHGFATISPDDVNVVAAWKGKMWMVDRATGKYIEDLPTGAMEGTHPDWSPLGTEVVFATGDGDAPGGSSLARIPYMGPGWGAPTSFLTPPMGKSNLFPMFSPDASWIAFSQGKGGHDDVTAQLWVVSPETGQAIELVAANRVTSNQMTDGQYQSSQPTWAPPGDYNWIAFNTMREYGVVTPAGTQQIWVAALDVAKATKGEDPSYPAFRVPFQGLDENNHRAYWTLDAPGGAGGAGGMGGGGAGGGGTVCTDILSLGEACDPLADCCETGSICDTLDSGASYVCVAGGPL